MSPTALGPECRGLAPPTDNGEECWHVPESEIGVDLLLPEEPFQSLTATDGNQRGRTGQSGEALCTVAKETPLDSNGTVYPSTNGESRQPVDSAASFKGREMGGKGGAEILSNTDAPSATDMAVMAPFRYMRSLPSKGVREKLIGALSVWVEVDPDRISAVASIIADVHNLSLMLDDVEDGSPLRRARPATHGVFGVAQTVNSATYQIVNVIGRAAELDQASFDVVISEMKSLLVGQSLDLLWTHDVAVPTIEEYVQMVDGKTGGLFRMISKLLVAGSGSSEVPADLDRLMTLFGRYFQIRDDYANIVSDQYTETKGYAEDLDEGKYSFVLIHALANAQPEARRVLCGMLMQRRGAGCAGPGHKELTVAIFEDTGSLRHTAGVLRGLWDDLAEELGAVEARTGRGNPTLWQVMEALKI